MIFGKTVRKGIAARMLEWANSLLVQAYVTTPVTQNGVTWYIPTIDPVTNQVIVKYDPNIQGGPQTTNCSPTANSGCTCASNAACSSLARYVELPFFLRQSLAAYGLAAPSMKGIY
jgi:hypothetical protein